MPNYRRGNIEGCDCYAAAILRSAPECGAGGLCHSPKRREYFGMLIDG